jgi:hypothetical protein
MSGEPDPRYWRDRAKETRAKADQFKDPRTKRRMLGIAEGYERLAERIDRRLLKMKRGSVGKAGRC